jgi:retron-type reverse transcriptase
MNIERPMKERILQAIKNTHNTVQKKSHLIRIPEILNELSCKLSSGDYEPSRFSCFAVKDPKIREIFAPDYKDRIVHHIFVDALEPYFDKKFIFDSYASRQNKGIHKAVERLQRFLKKEKTTFFLQLDIQNFFPSIDKKILFGIFLKHIKTIDELPDAEKDFLIHIAEKVIFQNPTNPPPIFTGNRHLLTSIPKHKSLFYAPPNKGLPIGSFTSQFFANLYLNELDQFIKHQLRVKYYIRYVDDFVLLAENSQMLLDWKLKIEEFLRLRLILAFHPQKIVLQQTTKGINFLGYIVRKNYLLVRKRVVKTFKRRLYFFNHLIDPTHFPIIDPPQTLSIAKRYRTKEIVPPSEMTLQMLNKILATINSYYGIFRFANSYKLRKSLYQKHFHLLKTYFEPKDVLFQVIKIRQACIDPVRTGGCPALLYKIQERTA